MCSENSICNVICKMSMQYSKQQCISVFKFTFSITPHVQSLVQNENEIILFTFAIYNSSLNMQSAYYFNAL